MTRVVRLARAEESFSFAVSARPTAVQLDPRRDVLRWEPEYGPEPTP